jgi:hypothetical protein
MPLDSLGMMEHVIRHFYFRAKIAERLGDRVDRRRAVCVSKNIPLRMIGFPSCVDSHRNIRFGSMCQTTVTDEAPSTIDPLSLISFGLSSSALSSHNNPVAPICSEFDHRDYFV